MTIAIVLARQSPRPRKPGAARYPPLVVFNMDAVQCRPYETSARIACDEEERS